MFKKRFLKVFTSIILTLSLLCGFNLIIANSNDESNIEIYEMHISDTISGWGNIYIYGVLNNADPDTNYDVTVLITYADSDSNITDEDIVYINQITTGENNTFLIEAGIHEKYLTPGVELTVKLGSSLGGEPYKTLAIPFVPGESTLCKLDNLANNTVFY